MEIVTILKEVTRFNKPERRSISGYLGGIEETVFPGDYVRARGGNKNG